jgi:hypothetical protein
MTNGAPFVVTDPLQYSMLLAGSSSFSTITMTWTLTNSDTTGTGGPPPGSWVERDSGASPWVTR